MAPEPVVDHAHAAVAQDQNVPRVRVAVEPAVLEDLLEGGLDEAVQEGRPIPVRVVLDGGDLASLDVSEFP